MDYTFAERMMFSTQQIVEMDANQKEIGYATGFNFAFPAKEGKVLPVLVTNRHVLQKSSYVRLTFTCKKEEKPDIGNTVSIVADTKGALFHPNDKIDLAVLPIGGVIEKLKSNGTPAFGIYLTPNLIPTPEEWDKFDAIEQVVSVGYPAGLRDTVNNLPIARRGITATPLAYNYMGDPEFLLDMPIFKGCSGSPVFLFSDGVIFDKEKMEAKLEHAEVKLLGILYSIHTAKADGILKSSSNEPLDGIPEVRFPMSIGYAIKSSELLVFKPLLGL